MTPAPTSSRIRNRSRRRNETGPPPQRERVAGRLGSTSGCALPFDDLTLQRGDAIGEHGVGGLGLSKPGAIPGSLGVGRLGLGVLGVGIGRLRPISLGGIVPQRAEFLGTVDQVAVLATAV